MNGNSRPALLDGWALPEEGFTWSVGARSALNVSIPASTGPDSLVGLQLRLNPFTVEQQLSGQHLVLRINGRKVCEDFFEATCTVLYPIPPLCLALPPVGGAKRLLIQLQHPGFARPCDFGVNEDERRLAFMFHSLRIYRRRPLPRVDITALPPAQLPADPDAVLRARIGIDAEALLQRFDFLQERSEADPEADSATGPTARFLDRIEDGGHIVVVWRPGIITLAQARALHWSMQGSLPNALLYVDQSPDLPSHAVERIEYGLFHGHLDAPFPEGGDMAAYPKHDWLRLCLNAYLLWQDQPPPTPPSGQVSDS